MTTVPTALDTLVARPYTRVSDDASGTERSPDGQLADLTDDADDHGWLLGTEYRDVGSASRYARKTRDDFDRLLDDLRNDTFRADILALWENSRGSRRVGEWVDLIDLCEQRGVRIWVHTDGHLYDVANPRDRKVLIDGASDSEYESAKVSRRVRREAARLAMSGAPVGRTPFGYRRTYTRNPRTNQFAVDEQLPEPSEAATIRRLYDLLEARHALRDVARQFEGDGVRTRERVAPRDGTVVRGRSYRKGETIPGVPFTPLRLRAIALNPAYKGVRTWRNPKTGVVEEHKATWPAIVSVRQWNAVYGILTAPERRRHVDGRTVPGRSKHLLSGGIVVCDVCDGPLNALRRRGEQMLKCHASGHVTVPEAALDAYVEDVVLSWLARPANAERLAADDGDDEALARVRDEVAAIEAELIELGDEVGAGRLSAVVASRAEAGISARLAQARQREKKLATPSALAWLDVGEHGRAHWDGAPLTARRDALRALLVPSLIGELRIVPAPKRGPRGPIEERVRWRTE